MDYSHPITPFGKKYIHSIWIVKNGMKGIRNFKLTLYPLGFPYISVLADKPNEVEFRNQRFSYNEIVCAQTTSPSLFNFALHENAIFIRLQPWSLYNLTNKKSSNFSDKYFSISKINEKLYKSLLHILHNDLEPKKKGIDIENKILEAIKQTKIDPRVDLALNLIKSKNGVVNLNELSGEIGISMRRLQQLFNTYIGLSPKQMASIYRLHRIIYETVKGKYPSSHLDYHYDQSHFIHDFKKMTNLSLGTFKEIIFTQEEIGATLRLNLYTTYEDLNLK